jgi:hypothetical protein
MDLFLTLEAFFDNLFALGFLNVSGFNPSGATHLKARKRP